MVSQKNDYYFIVIIKIFYFWTKLTTYRYFS